ncbi:hypothetical protein ES707_09501 [subsurface metagenome]
MYPSSPSCDSCPSSLNLMVPLCCSGSLARRSRKSIAGASASISFDASVAVPFPAMRRVDGVITKKLSRCSIETGIGMTFTVSQQESAATEVVTRGCVSVTAAKIIVISPLVLISNILSPRISHSKAHFLHTYQFEALPSDAPNMFYTKFLLPAPLKSGKS